MSPMSRRSSRYELVPRTSSESEGFHDLERSTSNTSWVGRLTQTIPLALLPSKHTSKRAGYVQLVTPRRRRRSVLRLIYWSFFLFPYIVLFLVIFVSVFFPSYTHRPAHYTELRQRSARSTYSGRANIRNEKIFIAASLYERNATLTGGPWAQSVLELVDLLGPSNVHLSIYENDPDASSRDSLIALKRKLTCNSTVNYEDLSLDTLPRVTIPTGETRIKRIAFLAEVRNRALEPLERSVVKFDRLLFINDVVFDPVEAAQLLFSTNIDASGRANYAAACAVDFINPFKFYDRFATRDMDGYSMGIPFYPWFTSAGSATSRNDVLAQTDAVRVRSCWGGMTAFEAKYFQQLKSALSLPSNSAQEPPPQSPAPLRFRFNEDTFWDSSECCLIHADLQYRRTSQGMPDDSGIFLNPYVRVAYDTTTLSWLSLARRPERLYSMIHDVLNRLVGFPGANPRQFEQPGETVTDKVWQYDDPVAAYASNSTAQGLQGHYEEVRRIAEPGGFCGGRKLLVINENPSQGEGKWGGVKPPERPR